MKKTYEKPIIIFEDFSLSTSIAAGCEVITQNPTQGQLCGYKPDDRWMGDNVFVDPELGCLSTPPTNLDAICYDVPTEDYNLFNS
ncbi:MAG: hypothetical protein IJ457_08390 [Clostridia bacterium]|nr:hypothetical protein [Clostridia bacterium]